MKEKVNKRNNQFEREDDYNPAIDHSNSIQEKWIHKQVVVNTGKTEDDFVIEEKPFLVEKVDLHKQINEEAKTTDLKYLLKQLLLTGDESYINQKQGFYGDISSIQETMNSGMPLVKPEQIKESLPDELKGLSVEELATLSDEAILDYYKKVREAKAASVEVKEGDEVNE